MITFYCPHCKQEARLRRVEYDLHQTSLCTGWSAGEPTHNPDTAQLWDDNAQVKFECNECGADTEESRDVPLAQWIKNNQPPTDNPITEAPK